MFNLNGKDNQRSPNLNQQQMPEDDLSKFIKNNI